MIGENELELVATMTIGQLESNAAQIKKVVMEKLADYTPENYVGRADEAKKDRAVLNKSKDFLNSKRLELERKYLAPFEAFKSTIKETCNAIETASAKLDEIVKAEEAREKAEKRKAIQGIWDGKGFTLYALDKVFNQKWLNKSAKLKDVEAEIDTIINRTFGELQIIERFPEEDVPLVKAIYLDTLNLGAANAKANAKANELKENRDRLAREATEREERRKREAIERNQKEETEELRANLCADRQSALVEAALGIEHEEPEREEYALVLIGTRDELLNVRRFMTERGVSYRKLAAKGNGIYTEV